MQQSDVSVDLSLSVSPQKKAGVVAQQVLEEMVLYDGNTEMGYSLNASARSIWDLCDGQRTITVICDEIAKALQVESGLLHDDVKMTIGELVSLGLLTIPGSNEIADDSKSST